MRRVGNPQDGWSEINSFTSSKDLGDDTVNIIAYGDMGTIVCLPDAAWCGIAS